MLQEYRKLVRDIGEVVAGVEERASLDVEALQRLNEQLTEYVAEVNRRLNLAYEWLRKGYRELAVEECEEKPPLLELVAVLDQPELARWAELVDSCGLMPPPKLATDLANELREAYSANEAIGPLLRLFRRQNLQRAPLAERLATLRRLCERDPEVVEFREDLEAFEAERLREIERELAEAVRNCDVSQLERLHQELKGGAWVTPRAQRLRESVRTRREQIRALQARHALKRLQDPLCSAWEMRDRERAVKLAQQWRELAATAGLEPADPLRKRVQRALEWAEAQEAVARLDIALDENAPASEIERLLYRATKFGDPLPPALQQRVNQRLQGHRAAQRARFVLTAGAIAAVAIALLLLLGWRIRNWTRAQKTREARRTMELLLEKGRWEEVLDVAKRYQRTHAEAHLPPDLVAIVMEAQSRLDQEDRQHREFQRQARVVRELLSKKSCEGVQEAERRLADLKRLAHAFPRATSRDRASDTCAELGTLLEEVRLEVQKKELARFQEALRKLMERERSAEDDLAQLATLRRQAETLRKASPCLPRTVLGPDSELGLLITRLSTRIENLRMERLRRELLERLTMAVGSPQTYQQTLEEYRSAFPDEPRSYDFARALRNQLPLLETVDRWNQIWRDLLADDPLKLDPKAARQALEKLHSLPHEAVSAGLRRKCPDHLELLDRVASRTRLQGSVKAIDRFLQNNVMFLADVYVTRDGKRYYVASYSRLQDEWKISYYISYTSLETKDTRLLDSDVRVRWTNKGRERSPEARWGQELRASLTGVATDWEGTFVGCIRLVQEADLDELVKLIVLRQLLAVGAAGSLLLERVYGEALRKAEAVELPDDVLDPWSASAVEVRDRAKTVLAGLPADPELRLSDEAQRLRANVPRVEWVGWLHRGGNADWICAGPKPISVGLPLFVVLDGAQGQPSGLLDIGEADGGNEVRIMNKPGLYEGMLVLAVTQGR